jgi:hypothetical protein
VSGYLVQQFADIRRQIAELAAGRTTHKVVEVTATDTATATFTVTLPDGQQVAGVDNRDVMPAVGQTVRVRLEGATVLYEPDPAGYAPDGAGGLYQATKVSGPDARYTVTDPATGATLASMTRDGALTGQALSVVGEPVFAGIPLSEWGPDAGDLVHRWGDGNTNSARSTGTELGFYEIMVTLENGRRYELRTSHMRMDGSVADQLGQVNVRYTSAVGTATPATPTVSSALLASTYCTLRYAVGGAVPSISKLFDRPGDPGTYTTYRFLLSHLKVTSQGVAGDVFIRFGAGDPVQMWFVDHGPIAAQNFVLNDGGGTAVTPDPESQTTDVTAAWTKSLKESGAFRTDTVDAYQGYYPDGVNGNQQGFIGFPDMTGTLSGATVKKISVYLYAEHWYLSAGGTAVIGGHGYLSEPSTPDYLKHRADVMRVSGWKRGEGKWVTLPSSQYADFKSGAIRGVMVGPGPTTASEYYGRFAGPDKAIIRLEYTK